MIEEHNCSSHQSRLWDLAAGFLSREEGKSVAAHVDACRTCLTESEDIASMREGLRNLPRKSAPPMLQTRLHVLASREHSRKLLHQSVAVRFRELKSRVKLNFDNLLRPLAVPAAGGFFASLLCFGILVDTLHVDPLIGNDIPIGLFTSVVLDDASPFSSNSQDAMVMVQLTVDEKGNVSDFTLPQGNVSAEEMREIGNLMIYSSFRPATRFGQPVSSKILVNIQHFRVRG